MPSIDVTIDGETRQLEQGTTGTQWYADRREVVAIEVDGTPKDLTTPLSAGATVTAITIDSPTGLEILRHSTTHVLAQAVQQVFPDANLGIGPYITDGFYYDFGNIDAVTPELLRDLDKRMKRIVKEGQSFRRRVVTEEEAREELADQPFKLELVETKGSGADDGSSVEVGHGELTIYDNVRRDGTVAWKDLCRGPHLPSTRLIGNGFALTKSSAAYWRGDQSRDALQRIYGTAWATKDDLVA
ncbi:MAG: threonine--tRNA ligase, partial [Pauljensenia sp.]